MKKLLKWIGLTFTFLLTILSLVFLILPITASTGLNDYFTLIENWLVSWNWGGEFALITTYVLYYLPAVIIVLGGVIILIKATVNGCIEKASKKRIQQIKQRKINEFKQTLK